MSRPKSVRILNLTYKIKDVDETERIAAEADGWCDFTTQTIALCTNLTDQAMADTFLHECIHAVGYAMGVEWKREEIVAHRVATGLCMMWKDNPNVFKWWANLL